MRKTSKRDFNIFKQEFMRLVHKLSLNHYDIFFTHKKDEENYASIIVDESNKKAYVNLTTYITDDDLVGYDVKNHARHEAIHLLLYRLAWLGDKRYTRKEELMEEEESIVRLLTKFL